MPNHIATYFYNDIEEMGATYGNIFLPLEERNKIYWQTVYTLFFSLKVFNKSNNVILDLFTNTKNFPFRTEIESLGVRVYDNLTLTSRNNGKWATVKFFFDVIDFISNNDNFNETDGILLLDTDVVAMQNASPLFDALHEGEHPIAYPFDQRPDKNHNFHGLDIYTLENIGSNTLNNKPEIEHLIGGEFFLFTKNMLKTSNNYFSALRTSPHAATLTTEEQILTIIHGIQPWRNLPNAIQRVWTTIKHFNPPKLPHTKIFLHLPSEKEDGLNKLFTLTKHIKPETVTEQDFYNLINKSLLFHKPTLLYLLKIKKKLLGTLKMFTNN